LSSFYKLRSFYLVNASVISEYYVIALYIAQHASSDSTLRDDSSF